MKKLLLAFAVIIAAQIPQAAPQSDLSRWEQQAKTVTIVRDDWGIAHVHGKTDADAVFGAIYAQAEDDFNRVETNFINSQGRLAEAEGEAEIWRDLRMKLFIDPDVMKHDYDASPASMKALMNAWADGLNFYLAKHPQVKPRVITHFEPWMALTFSEGSIGGDMEKVNLGQLQAFYGSATGTGSEVPRFRDSEVLVHGFQGSSVPAPENLRTQEPEPWNLGTPEPRNLPDPDTEPRGSNGAAVAAANTINHHALLLINPHTSFFFRSELQMTSDEGLNAYGASTWGQFFIYQGFNEHVGWMHTSSAVDQLDEYLETVTKKGNGFTYKHGTEEIPVSSRQVVVPYRTDKGMAQRTFTVYQTQHGPIVRSLNGKWVAFALMNEPLKALTQSWSRTKATDYKSFKQSMELHTNSSNNTIFADASGEIAYFHGNFIPKRDPKFDWRQPVDGSDPAADWKGLLPVDESPNLFNPASGWLYNSNNWPWSAAGPSSLKQADYPKYVDNGVESARGLHAIRVLQNRKDFTLDGLVSAAYDSYQTWFEKPIPQLLKAYDAAPAGPLKDKLAEPIALLRTWDLRWSATSVPTSVAIYWATEAQRSGGGRRGGGGAAPVDDPLVNVAADQLLQALSTACDKLTADFGTWKTPWGDINRFQRLNDDIAPKFVDSGASIPVMFSSATWGSLASFGARAYAGTKKWYGSSGNSFVAVVEFGPQVKARAVTAGGESGDPKSKHFNDQAERYATGNLREVYFYPAQVKQHTEREYHPGS